MTYTSRGARLLQEVLKRQGGEPIVEIPAENAPTKCAYCGMRGDADPEFHAERYGHWPVTR